MVLSGLCISKGIRRSWQVPAVLGISTGLCGSPQVLAGLCGSWWVLTGLGGSWHFKGSQRVQVGLGVSMQALVGLDRFKQVSVGLGISKGLSATWWVLVCFVRSL